MKSRLLSVGAAGLALALFATAGARPAVAQVTANPLPPRPLITGLSHWDDHWFLWLPHHPVYESIEVAMRDPDPAGRRDVWVWLSERAGDKRQIHYRNNPRLLRYPVSTLREFDYRVTGDPGRPRALRLGFTDEHGTPIAIAVDVDPATVLRPDVAAFTAQGGHSSALLFLLFYRGASVTPVAATATIGGTNYAFGAGEDPAPLRFRWGYSRGIDIGIIAYGASEVVFGPGGFEPVPGRPGAFAAPTPDGGAVTLAGDSGGRLNAYTHVLRSGRALDIRFEPGLPACRDGEAGGRSAFHISLPEVRDAVRGEIETRCGPTGAVYAWRPAAPGWAARQPFTSSLTPAGEGHFSLLVSRGAAAPE